MTTNPLPEFRLRPYDRLKLRASTPRAVAVARVAGRDWMLRCEQRIVFFREVESTHPDWTFAVLPRIEARHASNAGALEKFFVGNFRTRNIARFYLHDFDGCFRREFPLFFGANGSGVCREFYNEDDLPFSWREQSTWNNSAIWEWDESAFETAASQIIWPQVIESLNDLPFGEMKNQVADKVDEFEFLCGSAEGLTQVVRWICQSEPRIFRDEKKIEIAIASENQYARAHVERFDIGDWQSQSDPKTWKWYFLELDEDDRLRLEKDEHGDEPMPFSVSVARLFELALDFNTPAGLHWAYHDCCSGRAADSPHSNLFEVEVQKPNDQETQEAREALRAWLEGKVPASEIAELLRE